MGKKFSELKAGDSIWVWWYTELYEYGIHDISLVKTFLGEKDDEIMILCLQGGAEYYVYSDVINREAFVYGYDGHEYKIFGTSKEAVKNLLQEVLTQDMKKLEADKQKWLSEFDK